MLRAFTLPAGLPSGRQVPEHGTQLCLLLGEDSGRRRLHTRVLCSCMQDCLQSGMVRVGLVTVCG